MKKLLPEIAKCACGKKAQNELWLCSGKQRVICYEEECWKGPIRKSPRAAINAWNRVMWKETPNGHA